ncbi:MAG TPA: shikimate dehydrogenase [Xanthobacteraceae bacterium]|nr:shikimate dehydrogenase [Xanthobacteraceae bacterium]
MERRLVGLIGANIMKSLSPPLIEDCFAAAGMRGYYHLMDLDRLPGRRLADLLEGAKATGFIGLNITRPCKEEVIPLLDAVLPEAREIGAVNTVRISPDGRTEGFNTDRIGFRKSIEERFGRDSVAAKPVVLVGAGGAGRAVAFAMLDLGVEPLLIFDTDAGRAERLAAELNRGGEGTARRIKSLEDAIPSVAGVINATPIGMAGIGGNPVPSGLVTDAHFAADVIYSPLETEFIKAAKRAGARTMSGDGMLLHQGVEAFRIFTGITPDAARMRAVLKEAFAARAELAATA